MTTIKIIDPVTRVEGHLKVKLTIESGIIADAKVSGTLFRGFENMLKGRSALDAPILTQRICGVCPISHAQSSVLALEKITDWNPNSNGRLLRNLLLAANFIHSHILHFYVLTAADYVYGPAKHPWIPAWNTDIRQGAESITDHLSDALEARRKADEMCTIFGGKMPHAASFVTGGITAEITTKKINKWRELLNGLIYFIEDTYLSDVRLLTGIYSDYINIGKGCENLLSFGAFEQSDAAMLFKKGIIRKGSANPSVNFDSNDITENVTSSWYVDGPDLPPHSGETNPVYPKDDAYSWIKAPRLSGQPFETGPLARMRINGDYNGGVSVMDRHIARAEETLKLAKAMNAWIGELTLGSAYDESYKQGTGIGEGLSEAPRGAIGHWVNIDSDGNIANYQVVSPTCWNGSPEDANGVKGPIEQALIGTSVQNEEQPVEALRIVHSFDPCLACAVH